jgi:hypothetical protein
MVVVYSFQQCQQCKDGRVFNVSRSVISIIMVVCTVSSSVKSLRVVV